MLCQNAPIAEMPRHRNYIRAMKGKKNRPHVPVIDGTDLARFSKEFHQLVKAGGLLDPNFHGIRHATLVLGAGVESQGGLSTCRVVAEQWAPEWAPTPLHQTWLD